MSLTRNIGQIVLMFYDVYLLNRGVAKIIPIDEDMIGSAYLLFKNAVIKSKIKNMTGGALQDNLSPIEIVKILIPYNEKI